VLGGIDKVDPLLLSLLLVLLEQLLLLGKLVFISVLLLLWGLEL
jgi:hypothetical protein